MQVGGDPRSGYFTLVHADVETTISRTVLQSGHCLLREQSNFCHLVVGGLVIRVNVSIGAHQKMTRVVGKEIQ
jgi:hypothetical protein